MFKPVFLKENREMLCYSIVIYTNMMPCRRCSNQHGFLTLTNCDQGHDLSRLFYMNIWMSSIKKTMTLQRHFLKISMSKITLKVYIKNEWEVKCIFF